MWPGPAGGSRKARTARDSSQSSRRTGPALVPSLVGRPRPAWRKSGLVDQEKPQITPEVIVAGERVQRSPAVFTAIEMGGEQFLLTLLEPALHVPPQPVRFAPARSLAHLCSPPVVAVTRTRPFRSPA